MTSNSILRRALIYGLILAVVIAVLGSAIGYLVAGQSGLLSALIGAGVTALFMGFTAASILIASRVTAGEPTSVLFFGIILGTWLLKFVVFIAIILSLRDQPFLEPRVLFFSILAAVIGSLIVDVVAFLTSRVPYVGDVELPAAPAEGADSG